mmetsp:Transcript_38097/g.74631  ORF Transcript_38097/g.74631 Transcript_38097/m.74631 type:complete len:402 (+) Transcript_38097:79-1284(+)
MHFSTVFLTGFVAIAGVSAAKFPITNAVTKNTAENKMKSKLLSKARPLARKLDEGDDAADEDLVIDLTNYSIVFEKCQFVKFYNVGEDNGDEEGDVLSTNKFVIFKLCNSNNCSSGCKSDYAEYVVDMETYVAALIEMKQESVENTCNTCQENCQVDDDTPNYSVKCQSCMDRCDRYDALEENGYGDASQYTACAAVGNDDDADAYYTGAYCSDDGSQISIGVFTDEYCSNSVSSKDAATVLGLTALSDHILSATYSSECISCLQEVEDGEDEADDYEPETAETCQNLYDAAGKCETPTGFSGGYLSYYSSQASNEEDVCTFISSLDSGTYDQTGDIVIGEGGVKTISGKSNTATSAQSLFLAVLILSTMGLAGYAAMLHDEISGGKSDGLSGKECLGTYG